MKKFIKNYIIPTLFVTLAIFGAATLIFATCQTCTAKDPTSRSIQDMTQNDVDTLFNDVDNLNDRLNMAIRQLDAYRSYYNAVEHLLDVKGVDVDDPVLESDAGADYLDRKWVVDSLENINTNTKATSSEK